MPPRDGADTGLQRSLGTGSPNTPGISHRQSRLRTTAQQHKRGCFLTQTYAVGQLTSAAVPRRVKRQSCEAGFWSDTRSRSLSVYLLTLTERHLSYVSTICWFSSVNTLKLQSFWLYRSHQKKFPIQGGLFFWKPLYYLFIFLLAAQYTFSGGRYGILPKM